MKGRPVDQLVYECMFPKPRQTDPQNFHALLQRSLILEVRQEVHSFYGHLDTPEAKYPGLDYCHPTHRIRLSRWPWHRRLFRAFDGLRLTPAEIAGLTKWEGTKWAKERFEREQGITIRDTTADGFPNWVEPEDRPATATPTARSVRNIVAGAASTSNAASRAIPFAAAAAATAAAAAVAAAAVTPNDEMTDAAADEDMDDNDLSEEELMESVGEALNERLREAAARREAGETSTVLDEEWEQWLKNALETGQLQLFQGRGGPPSPDDDDEQSPSQSLQSSLVPQALFPPRMLSAARAGQWHEIPDFLHDMIRRTLETEQPGAASTRPSVVASSSNIPAASTAAAEATRSVLFTASGAAAWRRLYSDLRLPAGDPATSDVRSQRQGEAQA